MSSQHTISIGTSIIVRLPNNLCLPIGYLISGYGVSSNTQITTQTGPYTYTVHPSQTISPTSMISNPTYNYFDFDTTYGNGLSITIPVLNYFTIKFLKSDELTIISNVPEYTILLNFEFDDK